jgi:hypothetical protein
MNRADKAMALPAPVRVYVRMWTRVEDYRGGPREGVGRVSLGRETVASKETVPADIINGVRCEGFVVSAAPAFELTWQAHEQSREWAIVCVEC